MYLSTLEPLFPKKIPKYKTGNSSAFQDGQVCGEGVYLPTRAKRKALKDLVRKPLW